LQIYFISFYFIAIVIVIVITIAIAIWKRVNSEERQVHEI
jgi:uncharacterized membrane protein YqiK